MWLFVALVTVPPAAVLLAVDGADQGALAADVFAFYFAAAWMLLLRTVVGPQHLTGRIYCEIVLLALIIEVPVALALEAALPADNDNLFSTVAAVGLPEELAKALPVAILAVLHRRTWNSLETRDYLFLGAVSGLAFGAREAIHYYQVAFGDDLSRPDALQMMWRFVTDPVSHACWAGISAYFIGLAISHRDLLARSALAGLGLAIPTVLHGLNDWTPVNTSVLWVAINALSAVLFLAYATVGVASAATSIPPVHHRAPAPTPPPPTRPGPVPRTTSGPNPAAASPSPPAPPGWVRGPDGRWTRPDGRPQG
ncbi:PrsW family glutamic-type intramembrane protease [Actinomycetospora chiangmaiensis]|uniref:PrsW family glutamic-type intramembrane protease n=1 Tax=Actinomycetospora chiangmaiensis TaxID=402650 RepID=UPI000363F9B2|nr:PrsW family glutamic-type intramembrane protease [Actinomycetospora chiangmaiensis]